MMRRFVLLAMVALLAALPASAAISRVQAQQTTGSGSTSIALAYSSANAAGNLLVAVTSDDFGGTRSVADTNNGSWTLAKFQAVGSGGVSVYYLVNCKSGSNTVTYTTAGQSNDFTLIIHEYSGIVTSSPLDGTPVSASGSSTTLNSGNITTSNANDLIFGAGYNNTNATTLAATSPNTLILNAANAGGAVDSASSEQLNKTAGTYSAAFTDAGSVQWGCIVVGFKGTAAAAKKRLAILGVGN